MLHALRYLTVLPVGGGGPPPGRWALATFPVVGLLVGFVWAVPAAMVGRVALPLVVAAAVVLGVDAVATRLVHLASAARVADELTGDPFARFGGPRGAVGSGDADTAPPAPADATALGPAGTSTLVIALLLRFGLLTFVAGFPGLLLVPAVAGRAAMVVAWWRSSGGSRTFPPPSAGVAVAATVMAAAVGVAVARTPGLVGVAAAAFVGGAGAVWARRRGGMTDRAACACGLAAETAALMTLATAVIL